MGGNANPPDSLEVEPRVIWGGVEGFCFVLILQIFDPLWGRLVVTHEHFGIYQYTVKSKFLKSK